MTSEVFNTDCMEYMRTLPDKAFQLAIADPPYGGAGNDISGQNEIRNCRGRFDKYKQIDCARTGGTWAAKYGKETGSAANSGFVADSLLKILAIFAKIIKNYE